MTSPSAPVVRDAPTRPTVRLSLTGSIALRGGPDEACMAQVVGPDAILIATAAVARAGEEALCRLDRVGLIPGRIGPATAAGFALIPDLCDVRRERIAARLSWLALLAAGVPDQRGTPRFVPLHRQVTVRLPDGRSVEGRVDDLSKTGAKVRLPLGVFGPLPWQPGMQVTVGKRYAVVTRAEHGAIAVRFRLPFTDETFNPSVVI